MEPVPLRPRARAALFALLLAPWIGGTFAVWLGAEERAEKHGPAVVEAGLQGDTEPRLLSGRP
jgi:hypothetical protein